MIAGQMALCGFPHWRTTLYFLSLHVDRIFFWFDGRKGNDAILPELKEACGKKFGGVHVSNEVWNHWVWREDMMRMLDAVKPEMVLVMDEDEMGNPIKIARDIQRFRKDKGSRQLGFRYYLKGGRPTFPVGLPGHPVFYKMYPTSKYEIKGYKWEPGLTFNPYVGCGGVTKYRKQCMIAKTRLQHFGCDNYDSHYTKPLDSDGEIDDAWRN